MPKLLSARHLVEQDGSLSLTHDRLRGRIAGGVKRRLNEEYKQAKETFGIAESTGAAKLKTIRTMFRIRQFDHKWTPPGKMDENPRVWLLEAGEEKPRE